MRASARAIEFGDEHALPLPEHELAAADLQREAVAEQHGAQVRVGIEAIAIRVVRSLCIQSASRATIVSRKRLMSACSAFCASLMNTAKVVCIDRRLTIPSRIPDARTSATMRSVTSIELDALVGLRSSGFRREP